MAVPAVPPGWGRGAHRAQLLSAAAAIPACVPSGNQLSGSCCPGRAGPTASWLQSPRCRLRNDRVGWRIGRHAARFFSIPSSWQRRMPGWRWRRLARNPYFTCGLPTVASESQALLDQGQLDPSALENMDYHAGAVLRGLEDSARRGLALAGGPGRFTSVQQRTLSQPSSRRRRTAGLSRGRHRGRSARTDQIREVADRFGPIRLPGLILALADLAPNETPTVTLSRPKRRPQPRPQRHRNPDCNADRNSGAARVTRVTRAPPRRRPQPRRRRRPQRRPQP